ncbi:hypothetical protein [Paenibacillus albus]|uniref:50S ribosomal protein L33 n=1 Tax=Paenibacillus albus TaxID=2495582 RepID=A0A3Q8X8M4_9BACL|nr:hypothetical protein [Paenibacillus albus]AZN42951.1 hypothetical protein EJC50_27080 [Paenibacillus albus]
MQRQRQRVSQQQVQQLVGKTIYAVRKDGSVVTGKLVHAHNSKLLISPLDADKKAGTRAIIPLVLFDLLVIGLFAGGGWGGGWGGGCGGGCGCGGGYPGGGFPGGPGGFPGGYPGGIGGIGPGPGYDNQQFGGYNNTPFY